MTRLQAVGVLLIALGLIYALLYAAWLRKRRRHGSAAVAVAEPGKEPGQGAERLLRPVRSAPRGRMSAPRPLPRATSGLPSRDWATGPGPR